MTVQLRDITLANWRECIRLQVREDQKSFVASNVFSLAEAKIKPSLRPMGIYDGDTLVGFTLFGCDPEDDRYWIKRLMIGEGYQGKGYGRAALTKIFRLLGEDGCTEVSLSYKPQNAVAERLYEQVGFRKTGEWHGDEVVAKIDLRERRQEPWHPTQR